MQEEKVDSNDDEISPLEESSISPEDKDDEILKEEQEEEEKARVNDRRRFKSEEEETPKESQVKDESPSLVPSYVEILEKKVQIAEEKLQEHIARVNKESKEFRTRQEKDLERRIQQVKKQLFGGLLSIADDLSRANLAVQGVPLNELDKKVEGIESLIEGFRMIQS